MPRRPYRHKVLEKLPPHDPMRDIGPMLRLSRDELFYFADAVITGLLKRLERKTSREAEAAEHAIAFVLKRFGPFAREHGVEAAQEATRILVANLSPRAADRGRGPDPMRLLMENSDLVKTVSRLPSYQKRKDWLVRTERLTERHAEELAPHKGAELVERILAMRHRKSPSKMHKLLAQASKAVRSRQESR